MGDAMNTAAAGCVAAVWGEAAARRQKNRMLHTLAHGGLAGQAEAAGR